MESAADFATGFNDGYTGEPPAYIELPASLKIDPAFEMLPAGAKEPIKGFVREINKLIDGLVNKKRPE